MKDMAFYYPDKEPIKDKDTFIDFYSKCYLMKNNAFVEAQIEAILKKGKDNLSEEDIFLILAWKIGKIKRKESSAETGVVYHKGWSQEDLRAKIYKESLSKEYFSCIKKSMLEIKGEQLKDYIDKLKNINHLGPVYVITLRYFAMGGKYPIYDRFAYKGALAILENKEIGDSVTERNVSFNNIDNIYNQYLKMLKSIFKEKYNERKVDQALWCYGHMF